MTSKTHEVEPGDKISIKGKTYVIFLNEHKLDPITQRATAELKQVNHVP